MRTIHGLLPFLALNAPAIEGRLSVKSTIPSLDQTEPRIEELAEASDPSSFHTAHTRKLSVTWSAGLSLDLGQLVFFDGDYYRARQAHTTLDSWTPDIAHNLFTLEAPTADWLPWVRYYRGYVVSYNGDTFRCIHSHVSEPNWEPSSSTTLWVPATVSNSELESRGTIAPVVDTIDAIMDLVSQIEAFAGAAMDDPDLDPFEASLYSIIPDLSAYICFLNGRVPMSPSEGQALEDSIMNNPAIALLEQLSDTGTTAGDVKAYITNDDKPGYEFPFYEEFKNYLDSLGDGATLPGFWDSAIDGTLPDIGGPGRNRMLGFWKTLGGIGLAVVGVGLAVVGVVQTVACGLCGIGTIAAGVSTFIGGLEALGVDVPLVDGGGFTTTCTGSGCSVTPSGLKLGGLD
uniref:Chitin-binding type-3 domain-containing protein n=1 Tax=Trieres chinensis TaxID=1514140 RepID=A0A7S2A3Y4_TRICV|mmetsp:Transcript_39111/g.79750  ORF Transcript_39111/g.79750 Transcript_39111/m.79750 type:complete len:401 (+) Transcript_39111:98-1300(+)